MECSWDAALLQHAQDLPPEFVQVIESGSDEQYLTAITTTIFDAKHTYLLAAHCGQLLPHVCAILRTYGSLASTIATLGRIIPVAPYLKPYAQRLLGNERYVFGSSQRNEDDLQYLLGLFRLLSNDWQSFKHLVRPSEISLLLESPSRPVVYLAIRIFQIHLQGADHWFEEMVHRYLGEDTPEISIDGTWDDRIIDYRFLTLWEEERLQKFAALVDSVRDAAPWTKSKRVIPEQSFHQSTALIGDQLLPKAFNGLSTLPLSGERLVTTESTHQSLCWIASALRLQKPILLSGRAGSGKTLLVRHVAHKLGRLEKMVTLHLNEQSDAKLLMGIHTTGDNPGTFVWKPGVLTQAVEEGRWILIEDLDRAPKEIIGALLPLIERGELSIPSRKETLYAAPGFRILATVRSNFNHRSEDVNPLMHMLGARHWQSITVIAPSTEEIKQISIALYPSLKEFLPEFVSVFGRLQSYQHRSKGQRVVRSTTIREFLKWCSRTVILLRDKPSITSYDLDNIFLESIDCFVGSMPDGPSRSDLMAMIAEELRIDPQRRDHLVSLRDVKYEVQKTSVVVGKYELPRLSAAKNLDVSENAFSTNPHTCRMMERAAAAVVNREPLLLVGETGVGKTTAVQHLAGCLGVRLVPFNLSQQSEAGDLLGGFKPINTRSIVIPMKDEFDELFAAGFSRTKNQSFLDLMGKQMAKSNWKAVCKLWRQALAMVDVRQSDIGNRSTDHGEAPSKKRKVEIKKKLDHVRWKAFAAKVSDLEKRLVGNNNAFAFAFVEGNIVQAVRNGDWILLDEINLASPDTLESIADLFDANGASLLLTESGSIERIQAHPNFRVFAAMNPATDVGKKDLPPGIRSRFTELYVESPDRDIKSLQSIVRTYLRHEVSNDPAVTLDVSTLYQKLVEMAAANQLVDGAGQKPHFSLRTLTRTLSYAKYIAPLCSLRRALYEGFHMSFLTFLDTESSTLIEPLLIQHILRQKSSVRAELSKALRKPNDGYEYVQGYPKSNHWIRRGKLPVQDQHHYILTPFIRRNLENLIRGSSTRKFPILIQGPTSSGKTSMIEYLAKRSGHKFVRINNHEYTDLQEYLGTYVSGVDGRLQFQEGVLVKALREGHWIVLDELNLAPTDVLEALNRLLDDNRELLIPETQEYVRPHEDFMLFATQNPAGLYGGRKVLSRAFRNRFLELHFDDIPIEELQEILHRRTQLPESRCKRIVAVYRELSVLRQETRVFEQKSFATLRDLFRWALRPNDLVDDLATNGFILLAERVRKHEERNLIKEIIEKAMSANGPRVRIDPDALYDAEAADIRHYRQHAQANSIVWTKAMRRLYVLVSRAIQNNEPVLLVGETGCGKTTVCQMLARAFGKTLHTINAHQNTETGDIIGSQRPIRNRASVEATLRRQLLSSPLLQTISNAETLSIDVLLDSYDHAVVALSPAERSEHSSSHDEIEFYRARFRALFQWTDGSLVQAMKEGNFFLLDEISLADDSVLERLNSVLESQRSITLAEKGSLDAFVTAEAGFQFFATMNPGGDYGKRELSPALRNRFTEIWVPPLDDIDDITLILFHQLPQGAREHARAMVAFAKWFNERYNNSASSSVSVRDVLSWASFVTVGPEQSFLFSIVHGAAMVYIDTLGANPAGLMSTTVKGLVDERRLCVETLGQFLQLDVNTIYSAPVDVVISDGGLQAGSLFLQKRPHALQSASEFSFEPPTTRTNVMRVVRAMLIAKPILLEGSPGVGKTAMIGAIADAVGAPLTRINLSEQTDLLDLFGSDVPVEGSGVGTFVWHDAAFLRAMKNGEWVLLDEMNLASQPVLEGLNACLDHRGEVYIPELGQTFSRHPDFRLFAAQNPHHQGGGRKGLPASFVNRFTVVFADAFRSEDLLIIAHRLFPSINATFRQRIISFVEELDNEVVQKKHFGTNGGPWEFNLRDVARWLSLASSDQELLPSAAARDFVDVLFTQRFRTERDQAFVDGLTARMFDKTHPPSDLLTAISTQTLQLGVSILARDKVDATPRPLGIDSSTAGPTLSIMQSLMMCMQQNWPVILTGASGSGKSSLIARLAQAVGAKVTTVALNADSDAMDFIGGFEQTDPHRNSSQMLQKLRMRLASLAKAHLQKSTCQSLQTLFEEEDLRAMTSSLSNLIASGEISLASERSDLLALLQESKKLADEGIMAQFEWVDGVLVDALQAGSWLVLDNANLCNPSVLDRLNSLLEPNGALIVNEHSTADGAARILRPHPKFRIFLTCDPKYGDLSRAMRNRAVELYMMHGHHQLDDLRLHPVHTESVLSHFRHTQLLGRTACFNTDTTENIRTFADHASLGDVPLIARFCQQLRSGLYDIAEPIIAQLEHAWTNASEASFRSVAHDEHSNAASQPHTQAFADSSSVQTFHPLNNQALALRSEFSHSQATHAAFVYETALQSTINMQHLRMLRSDTSHVDQIRRLERSLTTYDMPILNSNRGNSLLGAVEANLATLAEHSRNSLPATVALSIELKRTSSHVFAILHVFMRYLSQGPLDATTLATYCVSVQSLLIDKLSPLSADHRSLLGKLCHVWTTSSTAQQQMQYGLSTRLWLDLRPRVAMNEEQISRLAELERFVDQFDRACRTFQLPLRLMTDLRRSFARTLALAAQEEQPTRQLLASLESEMNEQSVLISADEAEHEPHLLSVFQGILDWFLILKLAGHPTSLLNLTSLEVLALQKTSSSIGGDLGHETGFAQEYFRVLRGFAQRFTRNAVKSKKSLLQNLCTVHKVVVAHLSLLVDEVHILGRIVALDAHQLCRDQISFRSSLKNIVQCVLTSLTRSTHQELASHCDRQLSMLTSTSGAIIDSIANESNAFAGVDSTLPPPMHRLSRAVAFCMSSSIIGDDDDKQAADAWASFALACLQLYITTTPFDPALSTSFRRATHRTLHAQLSNQLRAFSALRSAMTGQSDTLRAEWLQNDLAALDKEYLIDPVYRPRASRFTDLRTDTESLMRTLEPLLKMSGSLSTALPLSENITSNVIRVRGRLETNYREYRDFTEPLVGFLDCLLLGHALAVRCHSNNLRYTASFANSRLVPFSRATWSTWKLDATFTGAATHLEPWPERLLWLQAVAMRTAVISLSSTDPTLLLDVQKVFHDFYLRWKIELERGQKEAAAKSNVYKYRAKVDLEGLPTDEELDELFPGEYLVSKTADSDSAQQYAQNMVLPVANVHAKLFKPAVPSAMSIFELLRLWSTTATHVGTSELDRASLPAALCEIQRLQQQLTDKESKAKFNIYRDASLQQVNTLFKLLRDTIRRFRALNELFHDVHTKPQEVLDICNSLLQTPISTPLTHILPQIERLLVSVSEWQSGASREYAVVNLVDAITNIIISWRRLELSSWAGFFEHERLQCTTNATSWWYIAYESIIASCPDHEETSAELHDFVHTLTGFLQASSLGEFDARLSILRAFEDQLHAYRTFQPAFEGRVHALRNIRAYYSRFSSEVEKTIEKGQAGLEKDVKNIIQVASWKDHNIDILRQSAKSSHKKLARLVRKLRSLLAEPVMAVVSAEVPFGQDRPNSIHHSDVAATPKFLPPAISNSIPLSVWNDRPSRFKNVNGTSVAIHEKVASILTTLDAPISLHAFRDALKVSMMELQKATPSIATEENKTVINHLKTRKRRLLADVLRDLRNMGFSPAMNEQSLAIQNSTAIIFAGLTSLPDSDLLPALQQGENNFHRFLGIMPVVRMSARKHSEDLTPAEATRCLSLLESMFEASIAQRRSVAVAVEGLGLLQKQMKQLTNFANYSTEVSVTPDHMRSISQCQQASMLVPILSAAKDLLNHQGFLSGLDYTHLSAFLEARTAELANLLSEAGAIPELPPGIHIDVHRESEGRFKAFLTTLDASLAREAKLHPELEPLLSQILQWTTGERPPDGSLANGKGGNDATQWTQYLFGNLDMALTAIADAEAAVKDAKMQKHFDRLTEQQRILRRVLHEMRPTDLANRLSTLGSQLGLVNLHDEVSLASYSSMLGNLLPVLHAYSQALARMLGLLCQWYVELCHTGYTLASSFVQIAQHGFCSPPEKDERAARSGSVESGTGLGDGEGGEDISGDIGDDEDISELAQGAKRENESGEMEDAKDAVEMADEEFEGELGDVAEEERNSEDGDEHSGSENDDDDDEAEQGETGRDAADEKMWDEVSNEKQAEIDNNQKGGKVADNDNVAEAGEQKEEQMPAEYDAGQSPDEEAETEEDALRDTTDHLDPHTDEASKLDLPDDIEMDGVHEDGKEDVSDVSSISTDQLDEPDSSRQDMENPAVEADQDILMDEDDPQDQIPTMEDQQQDAEMDHAETGADEAVDPPIPQEQDPGTDSLEHPVDNAETGAGPEKNSSGEQNAGMAHDGEDDMEEVQDEEIGGTEAASGTRGNQETGTEDAEGNHPEEPSISSYKRLGDILERWYDQHRNIEPAASSAENEDQPRQETTTSRFEHLPNDSAEADAQALGIASLDNSAPLDMENAVEMEENGDDPQQSDHFPFDHAETELGDELHRSDPTTRNEERSEAQRATFAPEQCQTDIDRVMGDDSVGEPDDVEDMDEQLTNTHISQEDVNAQMSAEEAQQLWNTYEESTRNLARILTEQLRLILHPTQATRMRGDFRTGKRLNIKKIIPYIASSYKRDKIWMRRSVPSKRSYQVMLAIDDSKSMTESNSHQLAFETLALIAKSLSALEVGELNVVSFGEQVDVAHPFDMPFTTQSGPQMLQSFTFMQSKTDVQKLLSKSIDIFRSARTKASGSASDLWQLQLIISDGICEDHPTIRRLIRQAHEERIMVVFIVIDSAAQTSTATNGTKQSILDLQTAEFAKDSSGEMQLRMAKYLDTFPFRYYLIVRDVQDLPGVLAGALRQWFAETVDASD